MKRMLLAVVVALSVAAPAAAGEFQDDLKARRARVIAQLSPESMLILWSAPVKVY